MSFPVRSSLPLPLTEDSVSPGQAVNGMINQVHEEGQLGTDQEWKREGILFFKINSITNFL